ncbi:uncharacterized protein LOC106176566 isoform X2 [Lingula anatina]|uniref:Uncharacterized protein LOC106176566 isoform X2 n=1 Tax=Lingula anatina TaxID=7574 RepID=A0A1S3JW07_LINAN|nr:uncharacterized protein LOC106176566 isoform X2 [Lingula anatina]|eukprot:XP_013414477.1 uncharacterized protein LOC106176566 isoform X2 [Lingula anatina]
MGNMSFQTQVFLIALMCLCMGNQKSTCTPYALREDSSRRLKRQVINADSQDEFQSVSSLAQRLPALATTPPSPVGSGIEFSCDKDPSNSSILLNAAEFCKKCIETRNGVGYYEDPCDCRNYLQCDRDADLRIVAKRRQCAPGTLYENPVCVSCAAASCSQSLAPSPKCPKELKNGKDWPPTDHCHSAEDLINTDTCCCLGGFSYCPHVNLVTEYFLKPVYNCEPGVTKCDKTCCQKSCGKGAAFDPSVCRCVSVRGAIGVFDFEQRNISRKSEFLSKVLFYPADNNRVSLAEKSTAPQEVKHGQNSAMFIGRGGDLEIPRFNNYYWGHDVSITFWYRRQAALELVERELLHNGDCEQDPSIRFASRPSELLGQFLVVTNRGPPKRTDLKFTNLGNNEYLGVVFVYNGRNLTVYVRRENNDVEVQSVYSPGNIPSTLAPLSLGKALKCPDNASGDKPITQTGNFLGHVDDLQIYDRSLTLDQIQRIWTGETDIRGIA